MALRVQAVFIGLVNRGVRLTARELEIVYTFHKLFSYKMKYTNQFFATYVGMTWHTGVQFLDPLTPSQEPRQYFISFLYDRSPCVAPVLKAHVLGIIGRNLIPIGEWKD
jgi:hypothetical protein